MNMTCKIAMDLAELYQVDLVSAESAEAIRSHLKTCPACRQYYRTFDAVRRQQPKIDLQPDGVEEMQAKLYADLSRKLRRRRFFEIVGTSAAIGAGSIMLVIGLMMMNHSALLRKEI